MGNRCFGPAGCDFTLFLKLDYSGIKDLGSSPVCFTLSQVKETTFSRQRCEDRKICLGEALDEGGKATEEGYLARGIGLKCAEVSAFLISESPNLFLLRENFQLRIFPFDSLSVIGDCCR